MESQAKSQIWKVHRRSLKLDGRDHTCLSLRPRDPVRFASNYCHGTWHVVTDIGGAHLMARLCWALAYQKKPGTFILIDEPNIVPNPFDADRSWPIVIANTDLGAPSRQALRQLKALLPFRTPSEGTVKLASFGLDRNPVEPNWGWQAAQAADRSALADQVGVMCFAGPGHVLKTWARNLFRLDVSTGRWGTDYLSVADWDGEVQIFRNFHEMVKRTQLVRQAAFPGRDLDALEATERDVIYSLRNSQEAVRWKLPVR